MDNQAEKGLSVIICARGDDSAALHEQLTALAGQDYAGGWELIFTDNGVSDRMLATAVSFSSLLPIRVLDAREAACKAPAMNMAVASAMYEKIVCLDADDVCAPGLLTGLSEALDSCDLVGARLDLANVNAEWVAKRRAVMQHDELSILFAPHKVVIGAGMAFNRCAFEAVGAFDPELRNLADVDLSLRMSLLGIDAQLARDAIVHYRYRADLSGIIRQEWNYARGEVRLYAKHRAVLNRRRLRSTARGWAELGLSAGAIFTRAGRARLVTNLGAVLGRVSGSVEYRVLYL